MKLESLRKIIPYNLRWYIKSNYYRYCRLVFNYNLEKDLNSLKRKINFYFSLFPLKKKNYINEIQFLNESAVADNRFSFVFPYPFVFEHDINQIKVFKDEARGLFFVNHKGRKLYYSRNYKTESHVQSSYHYLCIEQDERSPHRYTNEHFHVEENDVMVDIGAAEGNFSLEVIDKVKTLFIFETDPEWIEALHATFEPWGEKVKIINKYVSNIDNEKCARLDTLFGDSPVNFIKMDVEGAEIMILESSEKIFISNPYLKMAVCTYHRKRDAGKIESILKLNHFDCSFSKGYMIYYGNKLAPPYFRKGLIRAQKNKTT